MRWKKDPAASKSNWKIPTGIRLSSSNLHNNSDTNVEVSKRVITHGKEGVVWRRWCNEGIESRSLPKKSGNYPSFIVVGRDDHAVVIAWRILLN